MTSAGSESRASGVKPADVQGGPMPRETPLVAEPLPPVSKTPEESDQELDLWWGGYSALAMLPSFLLCGLLSLGIIAGAVFLHREHGVGAALARYEVYAVLSFLWLFQLLRFVYRMALFNYRLTTRRLFWTQGPFYPSVGPIALPEVHQVLVSQSWAERRLGIGNVHVMAKSPPQVIFRGVAEPRRIADLIERAARRTMGRDGAVAG